MKLKLLLVLFLAAYVAIAIPFSDALKNRPVAVKAGVVPSGDVLKVAAGEFNGVVAASTIVRVLFYFGSVFELSQNAVATTPEYGQMYNNLVQALKLDPYNQDAYYFSQAVFTWDVGRANEVNRVLEYGMKYRTWDWQLYFWAGFNHAYFLKNYDQAARHFQKAAELSGNTLFARLAARYFHESGEDELGVLFLDTMAKSARDDSVRDLYALRKEALLAVISLRKAIAEFADQHARMPTDLNELVSDGVLQALPDDPYGGVFYLEDGRVRSTSKFAFATEEETETLPDDSNPESGAKQ